MLLLNDDYFARYNPVIAATARSRAGLDGALELLETMRWHAVAPDVCTFGMLIHACAREGEVERAMNFHDEMVQSEVHLYNLSL